MSSIWAALGFELKSTVLGGQTTVTRFKFDLIRRAAKKLDLPLLKLLCWKDGKDEGWVADRAGDIFSPREDEYQEHIICRKKLV